MKGRKKKCKIPIGVLILCLLAGLALSGYIGYMTGKGFISFVWR